MPKGRGEKEPKYGAIGAAGMVGVERGSPADKVRTKAKQKWYQWAKGPNLSIKREIASKIGARQAGISGQPGAKWYKPRSK